MNCYKISAEMRKTNKKLDLQGSRIPLLHHLAVASSIYMGVAPDMAGTAGVVPTIYRGAAPGTAGTAGEVPTIYRGAASDIAGTAGAVQTIFVGTTCST